MFVENLLAVLLTFYKLNGLNPAKPASCQRKAADAAEGVDHAQRHAATSRNASNVIPSARTGLP
jgi:hypothetical protein